MSSTTFNNLITFSRGSNATLVGPDGLIAYAPNNLLTYSEQFDNAAWSKNEATISANATVSPTGTTTADKFVPSTNNSGSHYVTEAASVSAGSIYTVSVYAKASGYSWLRITNSSSTPFGGSTYPVFFDANNGVVGNVAAGATATITSVGAGWYRCAVTYPATTTAGSFGPQINAADANGSVTFAGDGTSGVYLWGAQLEIGTTATTYNSTTVKNLLGYSEAFDNAAWTKNACSIVTGAAANPLNGLFTAQKMMEDTSASTQHYLATASSISLTDNCIYTQSVYAKAAERSAIAFSCRRKDSSFAQVTFDLLTGTATSPTNVISTSITAIGNGWYRCSMTFNALTGAGAPFPSFLTSNGTSTTYTGDGNSGIYIWGAQLSDSGSLDPYVPTPGAAPSSTAYYGPRFDYDPVTLQPKGFLVEEQRTNLLLYSAQFDNAYWTTSISGTGVAPVVTANAAIAPDGTMTADQVVFNCGSGTTTADRSILSSTTVTVTAASTYANSIYVKGTAGTKLVMRGAAGNSYVTLTLTGGWDRFSNAEVAAASSASVEIGIRQGVPGTINSTATVFLWGAQLEAGAFATSYIPTVASTVTRSADVATISGSLFSQWYNGAQGTFVATFDDYYPSATGHGLVGTGTNGRALFIKTSSLEMYDGTTELIASGTISPNTAAKGASAYSSGGMAITLNGGTVATSALAAPFGGAPSTLYIGTYASGTPYLNGHIQSVTYYPTRLADTQIQSLTT